MAFRVLPSQPDLVTNNAQIKSPMASGRSAKLRRMLFSLQDAAERPFAAARARAAATIAEAAAPRATRA
jgi:hypothetical protein